MRGRLNKFAGPLLLLLVGGRVAHSTTCDTDTEGHHSLDCCGGTGRLPVADLPRSSFLTPSARLVVYGGGGCPGLEDAGRFGVEVSTWI